MPTMTRPEALLLLAFLASPFPTPSGSAQAPAPDLVEADLVPRLFESHAAALSLVRPGPGAPREEVEAFAKRIRARHAEALGVPREHAPSPVSWRTVATLERRGYTLKKIVFESRPGLPVPAHLYLPAGLTGRAPAVLNVHGHWKDAKCAPQVHARCVLLALRGFVCLSLDAIGAGERAYKGITYHGRQLGYQVLPTGLTLAGLQVLDNRRAIDLLQSLPEVAPERIGVTGASGGGNQTFNLAVLDERVRAAVPVCFYGAYAGYLRGAHCACELVPGVLRYAEEGETAGSIAPRALMIIAAKGDEGAAFRIEDARRSAEAASRLFSSLGHEKDFRLREFDGGHDYSREMREAMAAFFERQLKGVDAGDRVTEPELDLLSPEELRVLDPGGLPEGTLFVPHIAAARTHELIELFAGSGRSWSDPAARDGLRRGLVKEVLGGFPTSSPLAARELPGGNTRLTMLATEPGVELLLEEAPGKTEAAEIVVLVLGSLTSPVAPRKGCVVTAIAPRGTGGTRWPQASTVSCEDYLLAQGSAVLGRPILGQWVWDALRAVDHLSRRHPKARLALHGEGAMALVAVIAGALDDRIAAVGAVDLLASWEWPDRFDDRWGLSLFVPGILRHGDVAQIAAAMTGRVLAIGSPRNGGGTVLDGAGIEKLSRLLGGKPPGISVDPRARSPEVIQRILESLSRP